MAAPPFEILAAVETSLGPLCLRRRLTRSEPQRQVTEITLNHEFLMSSLHTDSERALAELALAQLSGDHLMVLVGGLGLGYTAQAVLESPRVSSLQVVEFLQPVMQWLADGLIPLAAILQADPRLVVTQGDIYARLAGAPQSVVYDAILVDVDHSPEDQLSSANAPFYTPAGIARAAQHLRPGGVLALWSYAEHTPTLEAMRQHLVEVVAHPVTYENQHVHESFTDWIYTGRRSGE